MTTATAKPGTPATAEGLTLEQRMGRLEDALCELARYATDNQLMRLTRSLAAGDAGGKVFSFVAAVQAERTERL